VRNRPRCLSPKWTGIVTIAVVLMAVLAWSAALNVGVQNASGQTDTHLSTDSGTVEVLPVIVQIVNFTIDGNTSGDTPTFDVAPSDSLVVFVELFGKTTVNNVTVEDGPNDTFVQEAYLLDYVNGGTHGFSIWNSYDVSGGADTVVNVTLTGGTTDSAAIEVVDVNGGNPYGGNPVPYVDQVADITHGASKAPNEGLTVHADDLALAGIGTWSWNNVTTGGVNQLGDQVTSNSTVTGTNVTAAVLYYSNANSTAKAITMNGTLTKSAPWIIDIITLGATDYTSTYSLSFSESGLSSGTTWCQDVQGQGATNCGTSSMGTTWSLQDGIYLWNISVLGSTPYNSSVGYSGLVNVLNASASITPTFSDSPSSEHFIQHVVIIVLENEQLSAVQAKATKGGGPYENYLAGKFQALSSFYAPCHPSSPEYLALTYADTNSCSSSGSGDNYPSAGGTYGSWENTGISDLLQSATNGGWTGSTQTNFTWADYAENLPSNACTSPSTYAHGGTGGTDGNKEEDALFASKHVPFLYEDDVVSAGSYCKSHILPLEPTLSGQPYAPGQSFNASVLNNDMRNFTFISPNLCDDGHSACGPSGKLATGPNATCSNTACKGTDTTLITKQVDVWLKWFLSPLLNGTGYYSSATSNSTDHANERIEIAHTAFFILYDEASPTSDKAGFSVLPSGSETSNDNSQWCGTNGLGHKSICGGNIYEVTILPKGIGNPMDTGYNNPHNDGIHFTDYGLLASVELLFNLKGVDGINPSAPPSGTDYGVCSNDPPNHSSGFTNPGCLDILWETAHTANPNFLPLSVQFMNQLTDSDWNGY